METRKEIEPAICKRLYSFASSIIAASDGVDAVRAVKVAQRIISLVERLEALKEVVSEDRRVLH
jgi:hypothetical protein